MWYAGNYEHDIAQQDQKQGIREVFSCRNQDLLQFMSSKDISKWEKEMQVILETGGER